MSDIQFPQRHDYTPISPFKMFVKSNFPFIEATFESLDNYGLYCKIVEYLNQVIGETNDMATDVVAFTDFTTNYFENLNVQEEINNKLDEMTESGLLQRILAPITKVEFVSSTGYMTDHDRIYVLTTNNHIYQYNSTSQAFVDTGAVYSSIDNTFSISNSLVTTSNYSVNLPDLDNAPDNSVYSLLFAKGADKPLHMPVDGDSQINLLFTIKTASSKKQIYFSNLMAFTRHKYMSGAWTPWATLTGTYQTPITNSNYASLMPDINNIDDESTYIFLLTSGTPEHYPITPSGDLEMLETKKVANTDSLQQIFYTRYQIYTRRKYNNAWSTWYKICGDNPTRIQASNYETLLPDINLINETSVYSLLFANGTDAKPANLPTPPSGKIELLLTYKFLSSSGCQIYFTTYDTFYRYQYNGTWQNWYSLKSSIATEIGETYDIKRTIKVGTGEAYTTLKSAVEYAVQYPNTTVLVGKGTYDLYEEFGGDTFFDSYDENSSKGLTLSNGINLIFSSQAKVVFNNENENTEIDSRFSPFNSGLKGFTIDNLHLECSRCRYAIHDERGGSTEQYTNIIKNSYIKHDNTNGGFTQVIGGGLGGNGEIIIENCIIDSPESQSNVGIVSYHNNNSATNLESKSNVIIKDNYLKQGTIRVSWCGVSTAITNFLITGNKLNSSIIHSAEREQDVVENTAITAWNNITS